MTSTQQALREADLNVNESMGLRRQEQAAKLSPVPAAKDIGRVPLRTFGKVEVDRIIPDPEQPRTDFDKSEIQQLAESIRAHGQLHPIRVRWNETVGKWTIITGERRWRATTIAGLPTIDCFFVEGDVTEPEIREQQLVENLLRKDLNPLEEAKAYSSLMQLNDWNGKQLAQSLRVTTSRISRSLALLDLPESVQRQVESGTLPKSSAYEISKLPSKQTQARLAREATAVGESHARTVNKVKQRRGKKTSRNRQGVHQVFFAENGLRVTISGKEKVNYHSLEQALVEATEEVRHRIKNGRSLF